MLFPKTRTVLALVSAFFVTEFAQAEEQLSLDPAGGLTFKLENPADAATAGTAGSFFLSESVFFSS